MSEYCFLTSVYKNTKTDEMKLTVESMENQTVKPSQIVIVIDGQIPEDLKNYIDDLAGKNPSLYTVVPIENNVGLGNALRTGTDYCRYELIARIDTDDISRLDRCEIQLGFLDKNPEYSVVGSNMAEFIDNPDNIISIRNVPEKHEDICEYLKKRCPMNHITVMFKKSEVEKAGGYKDWFFDEDSYLWVRMFLAGCKFYNIQDVLSFARVGKDMYRRRGGYKYYKSERDLFKFMKKNKIITGFQYFKAKTVRFILYVLMPNGMRQWAFKKFARK